MSSLNRVDDIALLDGGSAQNTKRTLRVLWANRYILRPTVQLKTIAITGPQPLVYGLSNRGARLLRDHGHLIDTDIDWSEHCQRAAWHSSTTQSPVRDS
jgi:hypothetical protein